MIHCGIDEAGYGPLLGPLVVGRADFELDEGEELVRWERRRKGIVVKDSKQILHGGRGRERLESSVLAYAEGAGQSCSDLSEWLCSVAPKQQALLREAPWFQELDIPLPLWAEPEDMEASRAAIGRGGGHRAGTFLGFEISVLAAAEYNRRVERSGNKHAMLFDEVLDLIGASVEARPQAHRVVVDKLGGRAFYEDKLASAFPMMPICVIEEERRGSAYEIELADGPLALEFRMKGDDRFFAVALASMAAKYTREALMLCFNRYWQSHCPEIAYTAGYWTDGQRFLGDLEKAGLLGSVPREQLVRGR